MFDSINNNNPPSRRKFLGDLVRIGGATAIGGSFLSSSLKASPSAPSGPYTLWAVEAVEVDEAFGDGRNVHFYRYQPYQGSDKRGNTPFFEETEGATIVVGVQNSTRVTLRPAIPGVAAGGPIKPGKSGWFSFTMPSAGTYLLSQSNFQQLSGPLGLSGVMVSRPSSGLNEIWNGGPTYDREYILHYQDSDSRWNADAAQLKMPNTNEYQPNYFTLNGLSYPDIAADVDSVVACNLNERVLLRFSNSGHMRQSMHFHGYHAEVVSRNNVPVTNTAMKDTIEVASGTTVEVILPVTQTGSFPLHPHNVTAVTANGHYPYGQLTLIVAS